MKRTNEEIYIEYLETEDIERKEELKNQFYLQNEKFIHYICRTYISNTKIPYEEVVGLATVGFVKAFNTFDPYKTKFLTYAGRVMLNEINKDLRRVDYKKHLVSIGTPITLEEDNLTIEDTLPNDGVDVEYGFVETQTFNEIIKALKDSLDEGELYLLYELVVTKRKTQYDIAEELGVRQVTISRRLKRVIHKSRGILKTKGLIMTI